MQRSSTTPVAWPVALLAETLSGLGLGVVLGFGLGIGIGYLSRVVPPLYNLGMGMLVLQIYLGLLGFAIGAASGVVLIARRLGQGGQFWPTLGASIAAAVLLLLFFRLGFIRIGLFQQLFVVLIATLAVALLAYNLSRPQPIAPQ